MEALTTSPGHPRSGGHDHDNSNRPSLDEGEWLLSSSHQEQEDEDDDDDDDDGWDDSGSDADSEEEQQQLYSPEEEAAVVRKLDRRLAVFLAFLYMLAFLDRSNIGNARIAGMDADLGGLEGRDDQYELAIQAFYVSYIGFEWMSLLWRIIPAHVYISMLVLSWGVVSSLQALATSYPVLILLRALLGIGEAGFTGIPLYLSFFFKRDELAFRTAIFISAAPLASSFASSLAWLILRLGEGSGITPWRLLFLVEGFPAVFAAAAAWHMIPDSPQKASYLTFREKQIAVLRLRAPHASRRRRRCHLIEPDRERSASGGGGGIVAGLAACTDAAALIPALMLFLTNMAYASLPVFLPTMLDEATGHDPLRAQALAAPPYLVAFACVLAAAGASDAAGARGRLIAAAAVVSAAGYGVLALAGPALGLRAASPLRYAAVYPAAAGFFCVVVLTIAWCVNNQPPGPRRATGFALLQAVGQCGPLLGARLYPRAQAPFYSRGMAVCAAAMLAVAAMALTLRRILARRNDLADNHDRRAYASGFRYML